MRRCVRVCAAAALLAWGGAALAASAPEDPAARFASAYLGVVTPGDQARGYSELFGTVLQRVQRSYAREVDVPAFVGAALRTLEPLKPASGEPAAVFGTAVNAALAALDPHSRYLGPREQRDERNSLSGGYGGLGMEVDMAEGAIRVVSAIEGTPAARAGLRNGDLIVRFDDQPVQGLTLQDAISRMRGEPGTSISLFVRRPGREDEWQVSLVRELIRREQLRWSLEGDVLVLRLAGFSGPVAAQLEKAIADASASRAPRAIVLDMRGNPGGLLNQAVKIADTFLGGGEIVSLRGRTRGNQRAWQADAAELLPGVPMVVLLDGRSASAAELLAAALQDNGRATVMGQRSFGKGSVQSVVSLGRDKGALRLTTALYLSPSGRVVQRTGVGPDIEVVPATARPSRREADRPHALAGAEEPSAPKARVEEARCAPARQDDRALGCALAFLQAGSIEGFVAGLGGSMAPTQ